MHKTGVARAELITFIGDASAWIWNVINEITHEMQLDQEKIDSLMEFLGKKANRDDEAFKELRYFHGNEDKCRYDIFVAKKISMSSGAVESAIRRIVNLRLKGAGMFWLHENAEAFLHLRCQLKSGQWKQFLSNHIKPS
ncbi:MAG: hypothetical protein ACE5IR_27445 [bacterium]